MNKQYFVKLLKKYLKGDASEKEQHFLEDYYALFTEQPDILDGLNSEEKIKLQKELKKNTWKLIRKEQNQQPVKFINTRYFRLAAAAILLLAIAGIMLYSLPAKKTSVIAAGNNYNHTTNKKEQKPASHSDENRVIILDDGSTVFLSPGSKLNYPESFNGSKTREVTLEGQAYFDIMHNESKPFIVHTGIIKTTVLGTAFNIKAINGEKDITVTVKRGKVKVGNENATLGIIKPKQQIIYNKNDKSSTMKFIRTDEYLEWKNHDLFIDDLTLSEVAEILKETYHVKITIKDSAIKETRFTTTFPANEKLDHIMESISVFNGLQYKYDKEKSVVTISKN